eukprot:gene29796-37160_t
MKSCRRTLEKDLGMEPKELDAHKTLLDTLIDTALSAATAPPKPKPRDEPDATKSKKRPASKSRPPKRQADSPIASDTGDDSEGSPRKKRRSSKPKADSAPASKAAKPKLGTSAQSENLKAILKKINI